VATSEISGYAFGEVGPSPIALEDLDDLKRAVGLSDADHAALRELWQVVGGELEALFEAWIARIGHFFAPTFAGPDGAVDERYMAAAHPRFLKWVEDTCLRPYDQAWLDYQHEVALRHHRTKKNRTDGSSAVEIVPYRYLPVTAAPMTIALREFLAERGVAGEQAARLLDAWLKALLLHVALWSHPYVREGDW
jgi:hypothetical protein